jgi:ribonuclease T2
MKIIPTLLLCLLLTGCRSDQSKVSGDGITTKPTMAPPSPNPPPPAPFDYYLLNLSWTPEYCAKHPGARSCGIPTGFMLHGLWPQRKDGSSPQDCGSQPGPRHPEDFADIYPDQKLLEHEWTKHGTCSGLAPEAYLGLARKAITALSVPPHITDGRSREVSMKPADILERLEAVNPTFSADSLRLSCGNNRLTAIEACLTKELQPTACGAALRSCRANTIKITPQGQRIEPD